MASINILFKVPLDEIEKVAGEKLAQGIAKVRVGDIVIKPGFDGQYGIVKIWGEEKESKEPVFGPRRATDQLGIDF